MTELLEPVYSHPVLPWIFGLALGAALAWLARLRYRAALRNHWVDHAAASQYQRSGFWLAALAGFVAATLPGRLEPVLWLLAFVVPVTAWVVTRVESRDYADSAREREAGDA